MREEIKTVEQNNNPALTIIAFLDEDASAITNDYLFWFIKLVLFQYGYEGLTVGEIKAEIEKAYLLSYTDEEILDAIVQCNGSSEIEKTISENEEEIFSITSDAAKRIAKLNKTSSIRKFVDDYCDKFGIDWWGEEIGVTLLDEKNASERGAFSNQDSVIDNTGLNKDAEENKVVPSRDDLVNLLSRFIYMKFRESLNQIDGLVSITGHFRLRPEDANTYSSSEQRFINKFLDWDNEEKNQMIYTVIVRSFDFYYIQCHEEIRFDFRDYTFILDANILMRYMRINNEYRYESVSQFLAKAKEVGVNLVVSAFTKSEVKSSIDSQMGVIKDTVERAGRILSPQAAEFAGLKDFNIDLYRLFYEWIRSKKSGYNGNLIEKFKQSLFKQLDEIIKDLSFDEHPSFSTVKNCNYDGVVQSLLGIRKSDNQAKTDANNVLLTLEYNGSRANAYMISSDQVLIHWSRETYQAKRSLIEVPSVWLSALIRYSGRAIGESDYKAFCQFIRLSIDPPNIGSLEDRIKLSDAVNKTDYSDLVKDKILEEISSKGKEYLKLEKYDAIRRAHDEVLKAERTAGYAEAEKKCSEENERIKNEKNQEIISLQNELDAERSSRELEKKKAYELSLEHHVNEWVKTKVKKRSSLGEFLGRNKNTIKVLMGIGVAICIAFLGLSYWKDKSITELSDFIALIIAVLMGSGIAMIDMIIERCNENNLSIKYKKKAIKKFSLSKDYFDNDDE